MALFLIAMLLACINYNLSLGYMLTFFVFATALGAMSRTHQNLVGLRCELLPLVASHHLFAGDTAQLSVQLHNTTRLEKLAINLQFKHEKARQEALTHPKLTMAAGETRTVRIALPCPKRGLHTVPTFTLASDYPLGLWRAWSYVYHPKESTHSVWVLPEPRTPLPHRPALSADRSEAATSRAQYSVQGDAVSHIETVESASARTIHWPSVAKGQLAQRVLDGESKASRQVMLSLAACTQSGLEAQLGQLCAGVLHCQAQGIYFVLQLGEMTLPANGEARCDAAHVTACLRALAIYE